MPQMRSKFYLNNLLQLLDNAAAIAVGGDVVITVAMDFAVAVAVTIVDGTNVTITAIFVDGSGAVVEDDKAVNVKDITMLST